MKFLSSSSSASSTITDTTTATSFDGTVDSKNATAGCIGGVLRRLLCLNSLPTYPSDHFREADHNNNNDSQVFDELPCVKPEEKIEGSGTPNLVARLMGLESLPQIDSNSISRSRSMNSVDSLKEIQSIEERHRRVKSFRETPTFLELEDENFLILSFESGAERMKLAVKGRKSEMGSAQLPKNKKTECVSGQNKENRCSNYSSDEELKVVHFKDSSNILRPKNNSSSEKTRFAGPTRKMKKRKDECLPLKKIETESDSENSSPVSVLDNVDFSCDPEITNSGELSRLKNSKTRRTLSEELENYRKLNLHNNKSLIRNSEGQLIKRYSSHQINAQFWGEISRMAEKDTMESSWVQNKIHKFKESEEISTELGFQILDQLVTELVELFAGKFLHL